MLIRSTGGSGYRVPWGAPWCSPPSPAKTQELFLERKMLTYEGSMALLPSPKGLFPEGSQYLGLTPQSVLIYLRCSEPWSVHL